MSSPSTLRIGLLGAGWFGREAHLRNLITLDGVDVTAASSRSEESLAAAKAIGGNELRTFSDWREVVALDDLDALIDITGRVPAAGRRVGQVDQDTAGR